VNIEDFEPLDPYDPSAVMFCPECGTLAFPDPDNNIRCPSHACGYESPDIAAKRKAEEEERVRRAEEERREIEDLKRTFRNNPEKRYDYIRRLGREKNYQTTYVIELDRTIRGSQSELAYPSASGIFPDTGSHTMSSRCFYVGQTKYSAEKRFHTANVNHMARRSGKVSKHRLIKDGPPYSRSIKSLNELTESYGFENPKEGRQSQQFEHYVAWALYKSGHRTWGPINDDLPKLFRNGQWLGEYPFL
tara:strand:- start:79 stop:819 length:741 start_codon:yes stop_codon:yes gene_type:complete